MELGQRRGRAGMYDNGDGDGNNLCGNGWEWGGVWMGTVGTYSKFMVTDGDGNKCLSPCSSTV